MASHASSDLSGILLLLKKIVAHKKNTSISKAVVAAIWQHLWQLSENMVALAFFDGGNTVRRKRKIVDATRMDDSEDLPKTAAVVATEAALEGKTVATPDCLRFFQNTTVSTEFLKVDLAEWESRDD